MKEKKSNRDGKFFRRGSLAVACWIVGPAIFISVLSGKPSPDVSLLFARLFTVEAAVDVEKQKSEIEKAFEKADELLAAVKLQDIRGTLDLLERKISKIKNDISSDEASSYGSRIEKVKKSATAAEDSLVNRAYEILGAQGQDSALFYTANELRIHGVPESKIGAAEKKILKEGPSIKQAKDQEAIARTVKQLENGQKADPSIDRFVLQSAQRIVKMRQDSAKAIEDSKAKKEMEEQKRQEKARLEKEKKDKKDEEERQAALKKEEEKKQREIEKAEKKRLADEDGRNKQFRDAQERARKDSVENARKLDEGKELARKEAAKRLEEAKFSDRRTADDDSRQKSVGKQDRIRGDSSEAQQKKLDEAKLFMERKAQAEEESRQKLQAKQDRARKDSIESRRKQDELSSHQDELRRMMEDEIRVKRRQSQLQEEREEKLLQKQQAEQLEKARKDSSEAYRKEQELQKQQEKERRAQMARTEKERSREKESVEAEGNVKQQSPSSEAERWGLATPTKDEQVEERKERERLAKLLEEERQRKNLREIQEVQRLAKQEKARQDSIDTQRRLQEQQENQRRIAEERKMKSQLEKERRLAEEQKKQEEIDNQRRIAEERKLQQVQEKERRLAEEQRKRDQLDSQRRLTAEAKERERQDNQRQMDEQRRQRDVSSRGVEDDRQEKILTRPEKTRKIAVDAQIPATTKPDMEQDEIQRLLENVRKEKDRLTRLEQQLQQQITDKQERARQDSAQEAAKRYRVSQVAARPTFADPDAKRRILQNDEERRRQLLALQEKARLDYQKKLDEEKAKLERDRRKWQQARQESMRQDNAGSSSGRKGFISVNIDKDAAKYDEGESANLPQKTSAYFLPQKDEPAQSPPQRSGRDKTEQQPQRSYDRAEQQPQRSDYEPQRSSSYEKAEPQQSEKTVRENDWKSKEKRRRAEKFVSDIYKCMEKNQVKKARQIFDANRDYISQYADLEVFNMVQQTIITAESAAAKAVTPRTQPSYERSAYSEAEAPPPRTQSVQPAPAREKVVKPEPPVTKTETVVSSDVNWDGNELEYISRINGFVREGNGKAAYKEFKKVEEQLKNYFTVEEFNHFKAMVENANK